MIFWGGISYLDFQGWLDNINDILLSPSVGIIVLNYFMVAVTIIVVAVPEGLANLSSMSGKTANF